MSTITLDDLRQAFGDECGGDNLSVFSFLKKCLALSPAEPCIFNLFLPVFVFWPSFRFLCSKSLNYNLTAFFVLLPVLPAFTSPKLLSRPFRMRIFARSNDTR